jgi:hypothetical protein
MPNDLHRRDKIRIERFVRTVDGQLGDLPRKLRSSHRADLRANLTAASADGGAGSAISRMGSPRALASSYLDAEYGEASPRPSWVAAATWALCTYLLTYELLDRGTSAFADGLKSADPHIAGEHVWVGIPWLLSHVTVTMADGRVAGAPTGGAWTPLTYVIAIGGAILIGRLWRLLPQWRRRTIAH